MDHDGVHGGPDGPLDPRDELQSTGPTDDAVATDPLVAARVALDGVRELPLDERAPVFERVHTMVVEELRQLELG